MAEKKSILAEALLDAKKIQDALNANTKEILRSVAREEIDGLVKESLNEDYEEETVNDDEEETVADEETIEGEDSEEELEPIGDEEETDGEIEIGDEDSDDTEAQDSDEVGMDQELGMDLDSIESDEDELDMTGASDDDVIAIYKKLSGDDEIEVVGDEVHLNISEPGEYIVKKTDLGMDEMEDMEESWADEGMNGEEEDENVTYEIAMDDEDTVTESEEDDEEEDETVTESEEEEDETVTEEEEEDEETIEEKISIGTGMSVGTHRNKTGPGSIGAPENPKSKNESVNSKAVLTETKAKYNALLKESQELKGQNEEFRKALKKFRSMLIETVVFNSNLSYVTKLFMEHSTTKDEKKEIIKRFDEEVTNLKESKKLYKTIVNDLSLRKPMNESIENKIIKEVTTGSSKHLNETTVYVDPSTQRIKDLIKRVENR